MLITTLSLLFVITLNTVVTEEFLDPTHADFKQCGFTRPSLLCDSDRVLNRVDRYRINRQLRAMEPRTSLRERGEKKGNCSTAGITPAIYLMRSGGEEELSNIVSFMNDSWSLDEKCGNTLIIVLSANDGSCQIYRNPNATHKTSLSNFDIAHYMNREVANRKTGNIGAALRNALKMMTRTARTTYPKWTHTTFPNPMRGGHIQCGLKRRGPLCDPDGIFDEKERGMVLDDLATFEAQTHNSPVAAPNTTLCREQGYLMGIAVMKKVQDGGIGRLKFMVYNLLKDWKLDVKCRKHIILAISFDQGLIWSVTSAISPLSPGKIIKYIDEKESFFLVGDIIHGLRAVITRAIEDAQSGELFDLSFNDMRSVGTAFYREYTED